MFAVSDPINDYRYLIDVDDAAAGKMEIRFQKPKNGQRVGINWYEEYLFETRLEELRDG